MTTQQSTTTVEQFMDDPIAFFGESLTQMHSIPRDELEELQRQAMAIRFGQHRQSIEMVRKLADRLGITRAATTSTTLSRCSSRIRRSSRIRPR